MSSSPLSSILSRWLGAAEGLGTRLMRAGTPLRLDDGRAVRVRPIGGEDRDATQAFITALSPAARYARFHFGLQALPEPLLQAMTRPDPAREWAYVAEDPFQRDARGRPVIVADARCVVAAGGGEAEFAVVVADAWQGAGLGRRLVERLVADARGRGLSALAGDILRGNRPMLRMMRRAGARFERDPSDARVTRVRIEIGPQSRACTPREQPCFDPA